MSTHKDGRALDHATLECFRLAAVRLRKRGVPVSTIAESLGVTTEAVYIWLKKARTQGLKSLRSTKAAGPEPALAPEQFGQLVRWLRQPATKLGYATDLWSGPRIAHLVKHRLGVEYHPKHMPRFLRRLGLVLKFPERRALEQDPQEVLWWKQERLPDLLEYARKQRALVFYADESLISLIPHVGKTWTFPEAHPIVRVSGRRGQHVGITAAVNCGGRMCFELTREKERFTAKTFLRFIRKLRREHSSRPIVLIVDGAPIHKAKLVKAFQQENSWLCLEILPAYSPELNPTEKSWGFVKTKKLNGSAAKDKSELRQSVKTAMQETKKDSAKIASFFLPQ
jgi:transposase